MRLPLGDWQFWLVSAIFLAAAAYLLRGTIPIPYISRRFKERKQQRRVTLTVRGRSVR
jgi:hypothetical protein